MNNVKKYFQEGEVLEEEFEFSKSATIKNYIFSNIIYIIMWTALLVASFYFLVKLLAVSSDYWFVIIAPCGMLVLRIWTLVFAFLKTNDTDKSTGYVLTNKAVYYYDNGLYTSVLRIALEDIIAVEKSEYYGDGFFIASKENFIHVKNILQEKSFFLKMVERIKQ